MYDHNTQRPRGYGFITYDSKDAVDKVLLKTFHELNGKMVDVKRAVPKELSPGPSRTPLGGYNYGVSRINNFLNDYAQGYSPRLNPNLVLMEEGMGLNANLNNTLSYERVEFVELAIKGTRNVLNACLKAKVKKVVVVSSVAAVMVNPNCPKDQPMDENFCTDPDYCKQLEAKRQRKERQWNLEGEMK
ncbi:Heterogeneous nuclear ribonucleoprotein 1 [Camellia lanceoleosa]|uniref:Heterogeneous nuclear ribonucleoprotein 1 n=1 Tax=Camellia lanceoleosa TaxID=1840588 RepID=A0ACC0HE65_9ERIC|nr:Heterogeneous nuclear ribonucleoprotein 1 [Camellia lanceoleosa]